MSNMGFRDTDCIREGGIENQLDVKAPQIQISLNKGTKTSAPLILFADSGPGMTPEQLKASRRLFNRKEASDEKNGCFGIGGSVASSQLTKLQGKATRLSKIQGAPLNQLTLDYPTITKKDEYELHVHEATKAMHDLWEKYALNKEHGTLDILECPESVVADMVAKLPGENLGRMYADYLAEGTKITIMADGKLLLNLVAEDVNDERNATHVEKYEVVIWTKGPGPSVAVQFKNGKGQQIYVDKVDGKQKSGDLLKEGYQKVGTIVCTSSIRFTLPKNDGNWRQEQGGCFLKRVKKIVERYSVIVPNSGDFNEREIKAASRHVWKFPTSLDALMGVEINKSRVNKGNIQPLILATLEELADKFSGRFWKATKPKVIAPPAPAPLPTGVCSRCTAIPCTCQSARAPVPSVPAPPAPVPSVPAPPAPVPSVPAAPAPAPPTAPKPHVAVQPVQPVMPVPLQPIVPVPPPPPPAVDITFSKAAEFVIISEKNKEIHKIRYAGQYHLHEQALRQNMLALGPARFKEYAKGLQGLNAMFND
jgi:hypothetical protein